MSSNEDFWTAESLITMIARRRTSYFFGGSYRSLRSANSNILASTNLSVAFPL